MRSDVGTGRCCAVTIDDAVKPRTMLVQKFRGVQSALDIFGTPPIVRSCLHGYFVMRLHIILIPTELQGKANCEFKLAARGANRQNNNSNKSWP